MIQTLHSHFFESAKLTKFYELVSLAVFFVVDVFEYAQV